MWSRNLVNTLQTVAQAVAPPVDSDDEEYEDDEEEYTDDDDDDEEPYNDQDEETRGGGGRLGFVGLLTRAMDHQGDEDAEEENDQEDEIVGDSAVDRHQLVDYSSDEDFIVKHEASALEEDAGTPPPQMMSPEKRESGSLHAGLLNSTSDIFAQLHTLEDDKDDSTGSGAGGAVGDANNDELPVLELPLREDLIEEEESSVSTPILPSTGAESNGHHVSASSNNGTTATTQTKIVAEPTPTPEQKSPTEETWTVDPESDKVSAKPVESKPALPESPIVALPEEQPKSTPPARKFAQPPPVHFKTPPPPQGARQQQQLSSPPAKKVLPTPPRPLAATSDAAPSALPSQNNPAELEARCRQLEEQLAQARQELAIRNTSKADDLDVLAEEFRQHESKHLQQTQQAHQLELETVTRQFEARIEQLERGMQQEQKAFDKERRQLTAQLQNQADSRRVEQEFAKQQEQLIQTMTLLDEREHQVLQLRQTIKNLEGLVNENKATHLENEDILEEVHQENDQLRNHVEQAEARCEKLKAKVEELKHQQDKSAHVQLELRLLKEELERERNKNQNAVQSATDDHQLLEEGRDAALALVEDYKQQLAATVADLDIAQADYQRILMANHNLQSALESFQSEREAEMSMLEEQRLESEASLAAAHAATIQAIKGSHSEELRLAQLASDAALRISMQEIQQLEGQLKKYESENIQMRRSLDEAIHRLQMNQEDVIDRVLMKNILMDWLTKTGAKERKDVLELMASVLHFSDEEKERVHISSSQIASSLLGKLTGSAPAPKADMENLQGDTVSEKWVSFLLAETED